MKAEARAKALLKDAGFLVYEPGQHTGACKVPYVVVHAYGNYPTLQGRALRYALLRLHCYVPLDGGQQTAALEELATRVKAAMRGMRQQAKSTGNEGVDMVEDAFKALSRTIEYQVLIAQKE